MLNHRTAVLAATALVLLGLGCNEGTSPTEPIPPPVGSFPVRLEFVIATPSPDTVRVVKLTIDGQLVSTASVPPGAKQVSLTGDAQVTRGRHTIRLVVVDQTSSPNEYVATGSIIAPRSVMDLITVRDTLETGEALVFKVEI